MQHLPIWFLGKIPLILCDVASLELESLPTQDAAMGIDGSEIKHDHRNTSVRFAEDGFWFAGILLEHAMKANRECKWDYDVTSHECLQYAEYGPEQHYNWHTDTFTLSGASTDRKITVVCLLNDVAEFEGGKFQMRLYGEYEAPLEKGTIIAFPSILEHKVTPVISGIRKSATIWLNGPRFK
jgi:PKHD-type hydroxylase